MPPEPCRPRRRVPPPPGGGGSTCPRRVRRRRGWPHRARDRRPAPGRPHRSLPACAPPRSRPPRRSRRRAPPRPCARTWRDHRTRRGRHRLGTAGRTPSTSSSHARRVRSGSGCSLWPRLIDPSDAGFRFVETLSPACDADHGDGGEQQDHHHQRDPQEGAEGAPVLDGKNGCQHRCANCDPWHNSGGAR